MHPDDPQNTFDGLLDRTLRKLPVRPAPATLETRVLGELRRRAALPWWRRSFGHWPLAARMAFVAICFASIRLVFIGNASAAAGVRSLSSAQHVGMLASSARNLTALLARTAPPEWFYQGIAICAVLYVLLFGLGAAAYRTLYIQSSGDPSHE